MKNNYKRYFALEKDIKKQTKKDIENTKECFESLDKAIYFYERCKYAYKRLINNKSEKEAVKILKNNYIKKMKEKANEKIKQLYETLTADNMKSISIVIEWKKNLTWGENPTAEINDNKRRYIGTASGCGYDKESAAIASALNQSNIALKQLYTLKESFLRNNKKMPFGSGYGGLPYFEGGCGVVTIIGIFKECGFYVDENHGKTSDYYFIRPMTKEEKARFIKYHY